MRVYDINWKSYISTYIYYKLLRQIITTEVNKVYHLAYSEETSFISSFIISEFNDDYNSKVVGFVNDINTVTIHNTAISKLKILA